MSNLAKQLAQLPGTSSKVLGAAWRSYKQTGEGKPDGRGPARNFFAANPNISRALVAELVEWCLSQNQAGRGSQAVTVALLGNQGCRDEDLIALVATPLAIEAWETWYEARQDACTLLKACPWGNLREPYGALGASSAYDGVAGLLDELTEEELMLFFGMEDGFEGTFGELLETVKAALTGPESAALQAPDTPEPRASDEA